MRIAFCGSGGTGKTTLALMTAERYALPYVKEGVREYMADKGITHLRELSPKDTLEMQIWINDKKRKSEKDAEDFTTCRTYADHAAYALRWLGREKSLQAELKDYIDSCYVNMKGWYDYVFFCPWGAIPLEDDGVRSGEEMYQLEMSCLILGLLTDWGIPYYAIQSRNIDSRLNEIESIIGGQYAEVYP